MIKSVVNITDNLCTKQENLGLKSAVSNQVRFEIKSGLKSRVGYNDACALYSSKSPFTAVFSMAIPVVEFYVGGYKLQ